MKLSGREFKVEHLAAALLVALAIIVFLKPWILNVLLIALVAVVPGFLLMDLLAPELGRAEKILSGVFIGLCTLGTVVFYLNYLLGVRINALNSWLITVVFTLALYYLKVRGRQKN